MTDSSENRIIYWAPKIGYFALEDDLDGEVWILRSSGDRANTSKVGEPAQSVQAAADGLGVLSFLEKDNLADWQIESPAKLVIAALIDLQRRGSITQIKERIESTIDVNWDRWWRGARAQLTEIPFVRFRPNRTIGIDHGFGVKDVPDDGQVEGKRKAMSITDIEEISKSLARGAGLGDELALSDFRRLVRLLISSDSLDLLLVEPGMGSLNADQLWSIFDQSEDPVVQATVSSRAIVSTLARPESAKLDANNQDIVRGSIPKPHDQKTLGNFLPRVLECHRSAVQSGNDSGLRQIITAALRTLLIQAAPEDIPGVRMVENLIVNCLRLQPDTLAESLLNLSTDDQFQFVDQSIADRLFGPRKLSRQLAAGIWAAYVLNERRNTAVADRLSRAAFAEDNVGTITRLTTAIVQHQSSNLDLNFVDPTTLLLVGVSGAMNQEAASALEHQFIGNANSVLRSGNLPSGNSLAELITRAIVSISSSQRSTNRRLRSDLNNLAADISRLDKENVGLRNRLSDLSRESAQSVAHANIDAQRRILKQVADALQFAQTSVGQSGDATRIGLFSRTLAEIEQYLPIRSRGLVNDRLPFDPEKLAWKGDRSKRPASGDPVTIIAQGWEWDPQPRTSEMLARAWCTES